jgi:hypothetical protein
MQTLTDGSASYSSQPLANMRWMPRSESRRERVSDRVNWICAPYVEEYREQVMVCRIFMWWVGMELGLGNGNNGDELATERPCRLPDFNGPVRSFVPDESD